VQAGRRCETPEKIAVSAKWTLSFKCTDMAKALWDEIPPYARCQRGKQGNERRVGLNPAGLSRGPFGFKLHTAASISAFPPPLPTCFASRKRRRKRNRISA
jgi:hypothetical protein